MKMENYRGLRTNRQSNYEHFKNIKGRWRLSTYFPFSPGAGKPGVVANLIWGTAFGNYNKVVIGEMGKVITKSNCTIWGKYAANEREY